VFAAGLAFLQWLAGGPVTLLWLKAVVVYVLTGLALRLFRSRVQLLRLRPNSWLYHAVLFHLFVKHFAGIVVVEARRLLVARSLAAPHPFGPGAFRSLVYATASLLVRSLERAERFYAAQALRGIAE
jgi:hypothetical protein